MSNIIAVRFVPITKSNKTLRKYKKYWDELMMLSGVDIERILCS